MSQPTCQWQLWMIFVLIASVLPGCQSARSLFPTAQKDEPSFPGPDSRTAVVRETTGEVIRPNDAPLNASIAEGDSATAPVVTSHGDGSQFVSAGSSSHWLANSLVNSLADAPFDDTSTVDAELMDVVQAIDKPAIERASGNAQVRSLSEKQDQAAPIEPRYPRLIVSGVRPGQGDVRIAVFANGDNFPNPNNASHLFGVKPTLPTLEIPLPQEPPFAIALYQDINSDGELTRNRAGIPVEPFAFSNNVMGKRGPPAFAEAKIEPPQSGAIPLIIPISLP